MIQIQFSNVSLTLGARQIFQNLQWEIQHDQKIGLIGPNGAGKSSLFKLITGEFNPEPGGRIIFAQGIRVGWLAQEPVLDAGQTAYESALAGNERYGQVVAELSKVEESLGCEDVYNHSKRLERALADQQRLLDEYASLGGESYPA